MLKKLLKPAKSDPGIIFPNSQICNSPTDKTTRLAAQGHETNTNNISITDLATLLSKDTQLIQSITAALSEKILALLESKYGFEPTDKYKEELENRKKYINQLDAYLQERQQINQTVESELKQFLNETGLNLTKSLESFSSAIYQRIHEAETNYGIDAVRKALLNDKVEQ